MRRLSARNFLTLALILAGVLPLAVFSLIFGPILRGHLDEDTEASSRSMLTAVAIQVDTSVFTRPKSVLPTLLSLARGPGGSLEYILEAFAEARPEYSALLFLDKDGRIEAAHPAESWPAGQAYSRRALPGMDEIAVSTPFLHGGELCMELSCADARRSVVGIVDLGSVSSRLTMAKRLSADHVDVIDSAGAVILSSDADHMRSGASFDPRALSAGSMARLMDGGKEYYASSMPVPGSDWQAVYLSPVSEAEAPLRSFLLVMSGVLVASAAGAVLVAYSLRRAVAGPLEHLVSSLGLISAGRYDQRVEPNILAELDLIGRAVNALADSIERRDRELKRDEERMTAALKEKTLLLKEVYHRVKNNLQIISSLLSMQASEAADEAVAAALRDGQDRVYAMSLVNESVYQMSDFTSIETSEYASRLAIHLAETYSFPRERIAFDFARIDLGLERAIPFGLALNEMLTNAFKYAGEGAITMSLLQSRSAGDGQALVALSVQDEGPGMSLDPEGARAGSLGLSLVQGLAEQLGGRATWTAGPGGKGTVARLDFPLKVEVPAAAPHR